MIKLSAFGMSLTLTALGASAGFVPTVTVEKPFGYAWYNLEHHGSDTTVNGTTVTPTVRSELNFPVDPVRISVGLAWYRPMASVDTMPAVSLRSDVKFWCGVTPSFMEMRDEDWVGAGASDKVATSQALIKISDTYSTVKTLMAGGEMSRELTVIHVLREPLALGIGLGAEASYYEIYGLKGRQIQFDGTLRNIDPEIPTSTEVGTFFTESFRSCLNFRSLETILGLAWNFQVQPLLYSHSHDDHLVRKKDIIMDSWGVGGNVETTLAMKGWNARPVPTSIFLPYLRLEMNRMWGNMRQTYYADSPDTPDNETGQSLRGISSTVNLWAIAGGVHVSFNP